MYIYIYIYLYKYIIYIYIFFSHHISSSSSSSDMTLLLDGNFYIYTTLESLFNFLILQQQEWMIQSYYFMCQTVSMLQTVPLVEILMPFCVPLQYQNELNTIAQKSLTVLVQRTIEIGANHQNPVPLFMDLLNLQTLNKQTPTPKLFTLLLTPRLTQSRHPIASVLLRLFPIKISPPRTKLHQSRGMWGRNP